MNFGFLITFLSLALAAAQQTDAVHFKNTKYQYPSNSIHTKNPWKLSLQSKMNGLFQGARALVEEYSNPDDPWEPTSNVENGHKLSGQEEFATTEEYATGVVTTPIILTVLGFLSLIFLNIFLCCRRWCKCLRCDPNDHHTEKGHEHDSASKRTEYINHQKLMVFIVEMVLVFCVLVADMLCYYGYGYIKSGGEDLIEALDKFDTILEDAYTSSNGIATLSAPTTSNLITVAKQIKCIPITSDMTDAYDAIIAGADATTVSMVDVSDKLTDLRSYIDESKTYVNDYLIGYADVFVLLVWSFAFVACLLFVLFRIFRSETGTKFAVFWGQITFVILMLVCLPFMIFSATFGDFCMDPSRSAVTNVGDEGLRDLVQYYATCQGQGEINTLFQTAIDESTTVINEINTSLKNLCQSAWGDDAAAAIELAATSAGGITVGLQGILDAAACTNFQEIWFIIMNDALCTNFYSGIYSLWVSQFITSFFLFWLIVVASISYHYFKQTKVYVAPSEDEQKVVNEADKAMYEKMDQDAEVEMRPIKQDDDAEEADVQEAVEEA